MGMARLAQPGAVHRTRTRTLCFILLLPPPRSQAFAGIVTVSVGHCHPTVNAAVLEQTQRLQHTTTIYLHDQVGGAW